MQVCRDTVQPKVQKTVGIILFPTETKMLFCNPLRFYIIRRELNHRQMNETETGSVIENSILLSSYGTCN